MRAVDTARRLGQALADRERETYVVWTIGWRTILQPEGKEVQGGQVIEYIYPSSTPKEAAA